MRKNYSAEKSIKKIVAILPHVITIEQKIREIPIENDYDLHTQEVLEYIEKIEKKLVMKLYAATETLYNN